MQLQLCPYRGWIVAHGTIRANTAVINAVILGICCHNQNRYEDQTQRLDS